MTLVAEKIVVTAREFLNEKSIDDSAILNEPLFQAKIRQYNWDMRFSVASIGCEVVWKMAISRNRTSEWNQLDRLFTPSPIATHANFVGCRDYVTGNLPEPGALVFYRRGNSWQGAMGIVVEVYPDNSFDIIEFRVLQGSENKFISTIESKGKRMGLPFREDKLNLLGFVYPKNREID
jgi:hypothetical protein